MILRRYQTHTPPFQDEAKTEAQMNEIVSMLFQKTITVHTLHADKKYIDGLYFQEHKFGELYATLCCTLSKDLPVFSSLELGVCLYC